MADRADPADTGCQCWHLPQGAPLAELLEPAQFGDVVLVAIPFEHYRSIPAQWLEGKTILDPNNYYPERDGHFPALDRFETTTSRLLAAKRKARRRKK